MKTRLLIIVGIVVILVASSSFIALTLQQTSQQCELLGGKIAGLFSCSDKYPTPNNEPKTASDCRMIFGKGTTEMYDCLEEIAKIPCETIDGDNPRFICNTDEIYSDEPRTEPEPTFEEVLDSCVNDSPKERMANPLRYSNGTHVFLNHGCEWKKIGVYLGD